MYLPEEVLADWLPNVSSSSTGASGEAAAPPLAPVEVRLLRTLLPVQADCPAQWLRDRLLRLADLVEETFAGSPEWESAGSPEELHAVLLRAGLRPGAPV